MKHSAVHLTLLLAAWLSGAAAAAKVEPVAPGAEAAIHFVQYGGIRNWKADRDQGLWIQDTRRRWYYARFTGRCFGLNFATSLGFDTRPLGTFDRFSAVTVPHGGRCTVRSLVASEGPPRNKKEAAPAAAAPKVVERASV